MNKIASTFGKPRVLLPVIHAITEAQVRQSADVAHENGADGVFVINQGGMSAVEVVGVALKLPGWCGVNLLGVARASVPHRKDLAIDGIWRDDAGVTTDEAESLAALHDFETILRRAAWPGLYFGGVAFKYREAVPPNRYGDVARYAVAGGVDVVTTSGAATGSPPGVDKVRRMREAIGDHALAVASGIQPENVESFLPYVDAYLVASGIESSFGTFDPARLRDMAATIHGWTGSAS